MFRNYKQLIVLLPEVLLLLEQNDKMKPAVYNGMPIFFVSLLVFLPGISSLWNPVLPRTLLF